MEPTQPDFIPESLKEHTQTQSPGILPLEEARPNQGLLMWVVAGLTIILFSGVGYTAYYYQKTTVQPQGAELQHDYSPGIGEKDTSINRETPPITGDNLQTQDITEATRDIPPEIENTAALDTKDNTITIDTLQVRDSEPKSTPVPVSVEEDSIVFAAGGRGGIETNQQIDNGGESAKLYTVKVNYTEKPVILVLGSYEAGIWDISVSKGTNIQKIILGGYYGQKVAGIAKTIPIESHIYQDMRSSDYFYITEGQTTKSSLKKWGNVQTIFYGKDGEILIGNPPEADTEWIQDPDNIPANYYKKRDDLSGKAGLDVLMEKGIIRISTKEDALEWFDALLASPTSQISRDNGYPITDPDDLAIIRKRYMPGFGMKEGVTYYVALKDFELPSGMYWAYSFYIPKGIQVTGNISNGALFDFNTLTCKGACVKY